MNTAPTVPYVHALIAERLGEAERARLGASAKAAGRANRPRPMLLSRLLAAVITRRRPDPCVRALLAVQRR